MSAHTFINFDNDFICNSQSDPNEFYEDVMQEFYPKEILIEDDDISNDETEDPIPCINHSEVNGIIEKLKMFSLIKEPSLFEAVSNLEHQFTDLQMSKVKLMKQAIITKYFAK
jgi:hypothetical protein